MHGFNGKRRENDKGKQGVKKRRRKGGGGG
jgi:hypothetical protein